MTGISPISGAAIAPILFPQQTHMATALTGLPSVEIPRELILILLQKLLEENQKPMETHALTHEGTLFHAMLISQEQPVQPLQAITSLQSVDRDSVFQKLNEYIDYLAGNPPYEFSQAHDKYQANGLASDNPLVAMAQLLNLIA